MSISYILCYRAESGQRKIRLLSEFHYSHEMSQFSSGYGVQVNQIIQFEKDKHLNSYETLHIFDLNADNVILNCYFAWMQKSVDAFLNEMINSNPNLLFDCIYNAIYKST